MSEAAMVCANCGASVAAAKRFKDSKGRAFCEPCAAALRARAAAKLGMPASESVPASLPSTGQSPELGDLEESGYALADERAISTPAVDPRRLETCPDCGVPLAPSHRICVACGFDRHTGQHIGKMNELSDGLSAPPKHRPKPCKKCGYDLTGLKTGRCPECGTLNIRMSSARETEKQTLKAMYVKPLLMAAIGLAIACLVRLAIGGIGGSAGGGLTSAIVHLVIYAISVPIGFVTYVGCSMLFIGFDEPLGVTFVRLAAVYAVTDAVSAVLRPIPIVGWGSWAIEGFIYIGMLMQIMELDLEDAWVVAGITYLVQIALSIVLAWVWIRYF